MKNNVKKEDKLLRVGVLGCGTISQAAHFEACYKASNVELYAICDVAEELLNKMTDIYPCEKIYTDYDEMLKNPDIDAVIIGIGDQFHVTCAKKALLAGKHVLVEKPIGVSVEECEELETLVKETGLVLQVGSMKRFDGGIQFAKKFIEEEIGEITTLKAWYCDSTGRYQVCDNVMPVLYSSDKMKKPVGDTKADKDKYYLLGHASHLFDTARYLLGDILNVEAKHVQKGDLYSWLIACEFANGAIANLDLTVAVRMDWHEGFNVYGTNGSVVAKTYNPWIFRTSEVECCNASTSLITKPFEPDGHFYRRQLESFSNVILNNASMVGATVVDGMEAIKAIKATYESVQQDGKRIWLKDIKGGL